MDPQALCLQLDQEVEACKDNAFASTTKRTYDTHRKSYFKFCQLINVQPVPATSQNICRYVVYLSRSLCYNSVTQYLNIIRVLHLEQGLPNPLLGDFKLKQVLLGLKRKIGAQVKRKLPVEPSHLYHIYAKLDSDSILHNVYWGAALLLFYTLLRRSNLLVSKSDFNPSKHIRRRDVSITPTGAFVIIRWTKTIQFNQKELRFPLPRLKGNIMCPTRALYNSLRLVNAGPDDPLFSLPDNKSLSPEVFITLTRQFLEGAVPNPKDYAGHSFRRGGASLLFQSNTSVRLIQALGDWASEAYSAYILPSEAMLASATSRLGVALQNASP